MASYKQIIDYVWVDESYTLNCNVFYCEEIVDEIPLKQVKHYLLKPIKQYKNPFKQENDLIVFCQVYYTNHIKIESSKLSEFNTFIDEFNDIVVVAKYNNKEINDNLKKCFRYMNINAFISKEEVTLNTEKDNIYCDIWMCKYLIKTLLNQDDDNCAEILLYDNVLENVILNMSSIKLK